MSTVLMIGTRKGLWIGRSDEHREEWEFTGPHQDMEEVYSCLVDTRARPPPAAARRARPRAGSDRRCAGPTTSAPPGRRPPRRDPVRRERGRVGRAGLAARPRRRATASCRPAPSPAPCGARPTAASTSRSRRRCGTTRTGPDWGAGFGGQAFHTILPHPTDPDVGDGGDLDRRRLPDRRRRRLVDARATRASAPSSCPRASSTPSSASACTR